MNPIELIRLGRSLAFLLRGISEHIVPFSEVLVPMSEGIEPWHMAEYSCLSKVGVPYCKVPLASLLHLEKVEARNIGQFAGLRVPFL